MPAIKFFYWRGRPAGCTLKFPPPISTETAISENVTSPVAMHDFSFIFILAGTGRIYPEEIHAN
jgi:hypothetical protein